MSKLATDELKRLKKRAILRETKRAEILEWYLAVTGGVPPARQCEDKKAYGEVVYWWLEPPIPNVVNPVLVERAIGDGWVLELVPMRGT